MKQKDYMNLINELLNELENNINLISLKSSYHSIIVLCQKICNLTLELQLKVEGYNTSEIPKQTLQLIHFCNQKKIIPKYQINCLYTIKRLFNKVIHGKKPTYQETYKILNLFINYFNWFDSSYLTYYSQEKQLNIESLILKISSLPSPPQNEKNNQNYTKTVNWNNVNKISITNDYKLTQQEEENYIYQINESLTDYECQLSSISHEKNYYLILVGQNITELMLKLLIKKEGYEISENYYNFFKMIQFTYEKEIIPKECYNFLNLIRKYRNEFVHEIKTPNKLTLSFLNAFNYFLQWFGNYYSPIYDTCSQVKIEKCCEIINKLNKNKKTTEYVNKYKIPDQSKKKHDLNLIDKDEEIIKLKIENERNKKLLKKEQIEKEKLLKNEQNLKEKLAKKEEEIKTNKQNYDLKMDLILKKLDDESKLFENCMKILQENLKTTERIEEKIDNINTKIEHLTNQISIFQSDAKKKIINTNSKEEREKIYEDFMNKCINNIMIQSSKLHENRDYELEKRKLISSMGEDAWIKLSEKSKSFLITSKIIYNRLIMINEITDYSGICVLVTKALEVEIKKRFFINFLNYLNENYGTDYSKYPTSLLFKNKIPLRSDKFTMGNIAFVFCYNKNKYDTIDQKINNKSKLIEYCRLHVFSNYTDAEIKELLNKYASSIESIRKNYRNPSAHTNEIKRVDAEECFNLVLDVEKLLKKMLDSFDN